MSPKEGEWKIVSTEDDFDEFDIETEKRVTDEPVMTVVFERADWQGADHGKT